MDAVELARLAPSVADRIEHVEAFAVHYLILPVLPVGQVHELRGVIPREGYLLGRAGAERPGLDEDLLDERPLQGEDPEPVGGPVADIGETVIGGSAQ